MSIKEKLALMREIERRNDDRWNITTEEQRIRQMAVEYSHMEGMMNLYVR